MTTPRLYYFSGSPFARAMRVLAFEWSLDVEQVELPFPPPDDLFRINPFGQVPALETNGRHVFPTIPIGLEFWKMAGAPDHAYAADKDLQVLLAISQLGDALVAANYQKWAGLETVSENRLGFDPAQRHLSRVGPAIAWIDPHLRPGITLSGVLFACLMLWAEDRAGLDWRALTSATPLVDDLAKRNSFAATVPAPWE